MLMKWGFSGKECLLEPLFQGMKQKQQVPRPQKIDWHVVLVEI
jgi:hypothetical protein